MIRNYSQNDASQLAAIYSYYIEHSHHTFETSAIDEIEMHKRVSVILAHYPCIVYEEHGEVLAYAYATRWKVRQAYDHTVETSIYVKAGAHKKGIGSLLYVELLDRLKKLDLHCLLAGISLPNDVSIHLHEKLGFKKNGVLKEVGFKFDKWIDVGYWSLLI